MHAALDFALEYPEHFKRWHESNYIVVLTVKDESSLLELSNKFKGLGRAVTSFRESDMDDELTSICIEPHEGNKKLLSCLPLAGKIKT